MDKADLVRDNFEQAAAVYDNSPVFPLCGKRLAELAACEPGSRVLDIATGTGAVLVQLADAVGAAGKVTGIDFAQSMVDATAAEIERRGLRNASALRMNAEKLEFDDGSFDAATCGFALWFIPDIDRALAEALRVLRSGARFVVSTWGPEDPFLTRYNELVVAHGGHVPELGSHVLMTSQAVREKLKGAGFRVDYADDEDISVTYKDANECWDQRMANHQLNGLTVPASNREAFKSAVLSRAMELATREGIRHARKAVFAVGVKQAGG